MKALSRLDRLEAESIFIFREVAATCDNPVLLYSIGKDSCVLLHLARKAFFPGKLPRRCRFRCCISTQAGSSGP